MSEVTYGRLDKVLRSLEFESYLAETAMHIPARVYKNEATGAMVVLPPLPFEQEVYPHHMGAVRVILHAYGLAEPMELDRKLQKAS